MSTDTELKFTVRLNKRDYMELWRATPLRFLTWVLFLIGAYYLYWAVRVFLDCGFNEDTFWTLISYAFVAAFALFGAFIFPRLRARVAFRGPVFLEPREYSATESGLHCESRLFDGRYRWPAFTSIKETRRAFLFSVSPAAVLVVPKHCLPTKEDVDRLRTLINKHFQGKKRLQNA